MSFKGIDYGKSLGATAIACSDQDILKNSEFVVFAHSRGLKVITYELSPDLNSLRSYDSSIISKKSAWNQLMQYKVDGIETDFARDLQVYKDK